jgi:predicted dehydrogenase
VIRSDTPSLRIGLVGFGRLARSYYLPAVGRLPGAGVVAVADPLEASRAAAATALPGAAICRGMDELLAHGPGALLVATPPSTHLALWNAAQARGLPVFMEKPFVLAGQIASATDDAAARRRLMVNFNREFWPPYRRLRRLVADGRIGRIVTAEFTLHVDLLPWCSVTRHRLSPDDGGLLHDLGSQALAFVPWLLGAEPVSVEVTLASHRWPDDHLTLRLRFPDGAGATCDLAYESRTFERVAIAGSTGRIRLEDPNMAVHLEPSSDGRRRGQLRDLAVLGYRALRRSHSMARYSIHAALAAFVEATRGQRPFVPGWEAAVRNVRALEAAILAARRGRAVPLEMAS